MTSRLLLVAGEVSFEYLVYPSIPMSDGAAHGPSGAYDDGEVSQMVIRTGGADLVSRLLAAATPQHDIHVLGPALPPAASNCLKHNASCVCDLDLSDTASDGQPTYSVSRIRHIGKSPAWHSPAINTAATPSASTVVITGSGGHFRDVELALDFLQRVRPRYIIYNMTLPLASGPLWDMIRNGPMTRDGVPEPDFMAVVIDADDLRAEGITLSQSLSWEATAEDFVRNLGSYGRLDTLVTCPNLIVRFGTEGVIHHRGRAAVDPLLYYHPRKMETERRLKGTHHMVGFTCCNRHLLF